MNINFEVFGALELEKKLAGLNAIRLEAVVRKQVVQMLNRARQPGGTPVDTGELRKSSSASGDEVGYTAEYAAHVEYGHRTKNGGYVPGQRYLQRNVEQQRPIYKEDLINAIKKES
mgnify:FL=1